MKTIPAEIAAICFKLDGVSLWRTSVARFDVTSFVREVLNNNLGRADVFTKCAYGSNALIGAIDDYLDLLYAAQPGLLVAPLTREQASEKTTVPKLSVDGVLEEFMRLSLPFTAEMVTPMAFQSEVDQMVIIQRLLFPEIFTTPCEDIFKKYVTNPECEGMFCCNFNLVWFVTRDQKGNGPFTYVCSDLKIINILKNNDFISSNQHKYEPGIATPHIDNLKNFEDKNKADEFRRIVQLGLERS